MAKRTSKPRKKPNQKRKVEAEVSSQPDSILGLVKRSFGIIFKNWKLFLPLFVIAILLGWLMVGVSEDAMIIMVTFTILLLWLVTIFLTRHILKGNKIKFRDGIFNAMAPLVSTLIIFVVLLIQCLPVFLVIIAYPSAIETELFNDVLAGILFVLFAICMVALSGYLLSGTLMALIAVTVPGVYPLTALGLTREVMVGEKMKFILRLLVLALVLVVISAVVVGIGILVELWLASMGRAVSAAIVSMYVAGCFSVIFSAVYLYLYYRKVLMMEEK